MTTLREAAQQALEALEMHVPQYLKDRGYPPITALKAALAEPTPLEDVVTYGSAWSKDGKRIDPMSVCAEPVQEQPVCDECGKSKSDGWALYCVGCVEPMFVSKAEPVAWGVFDGPNLHDVNFTEEEAHEMVRLKGDGSVVKLLYTAPLQRKPLTEEEIINIGKEAHAVEGPHILPVTFARAIERAVWEKNT